LIDGVNVGASILPFQVQERLGNIVAAISEVQPGAKSADVLRAQKAEAMHV
jgi:hypothetical protein